MDELFEIDYTENKYKYTLFDIGFIRRWENELYDKYLDEIDSFLNISDNIEYNENLKKDVLEALILSLKNRKDFYSNAKLYIKKRMHNNEKMMNDPDILF